MTTRYDEPNQIAKLGNELLRRLAEWGVSIAGTRALRVRGRRSGQWRGVVVNVLAVDGREYVVSPRGNTEWVRNARAAGNVEAGPRWNRRTLTVAEVPDADKPELVRRYLDRWYWQVKNYVGGLTPTSGESELRRIVPSIPVFELLS